jgi:hypothetical protein
MRVWSTLALLSLVLSLGCIQEDGQADAGSFSMYVAALENKNVGHCGRIESQQYQRACYRDYAAARGDALICSKLEDDYAVDECVANTAYETQNINLCSRIRDEDRKAYCEAVVKRAVRYCRQVEDESLRRLCLSHTAVKTRNPSLCEGLPGEAECTAVASRETADPHGQGILPHPHSGREKRRLSVQ